MSTFPTTWHLPAEKPTIVTSRKQRRIDERTKKRQDIAAYSLIAAFASSALTFGAVMLDLGWGLF